MIGTSQRRRLLALAILIVLLTIVNLAILISRMTLLPLDLPATRALQTIQAPWFKYLMYIVSVPGWYPWSIVAVTIVGIIAGWFFSPRIGIYVFIIATLQGPLNWLIKDIIARPRPSETLVEIMKPETGYSFPSGHVMFYTIFFGFLIFLVLKYISRRKFKAIVLLLLGGIILLVGVSRIYLGAHWFSDVFAGYLVGLAYLGWAIEIFRSLPALNPDTSVSVSVR